jgi:hypothetical protein
VPGGEKQVDHVEHRLDPFGEFVEGRDLIRDPGKGDLFFRPRDAGGHCGLGDQECSSHLGGGEPAEEPQGERYTGVGGDSGVAAGEDQTETVIGDLGELVQCGVLHPFGLGGVWLR